VLGTGDIAGRDFGKATGCGERLGYGIAYGLEMVRQTFQKDQRAGDWMILDPGDGGAIEAGKSGVCPLTIGAGAETRKVPAPTQHGQWLVINVNKVAGGSVTLTFVDPDGTAVNFQPVITTPALSATTSVLMLRSALSSGVFKWVGTGNYA
jgi:hypothetical protein